MIPHFAAAAIVSFAAPCAGQDDAARDLPAERSPVSTALRADDPEALRDALRHQTDWTSIRIDGKSPLAWAAARGSIESVTILLDAGADVDEVAPGELRPLDLAAWNGHADLASLLVDRGADPNRRTESIHGAVPLDHAAREGHMDILRTLLANGADPNGDAALARAISHEQWSAAGALLDAGADPSHRDALFVAAERAPLDLFSRMVEAGGDIHGQDYYGGVLAKACTSLVKVKLLTSRGVDVNGSRQDGYRAMHQAAFLGALDVGQFLAQHGAELDVAMADGQRPVDLALRRHHPEFVAWLREAGVAPSLALATAMDDAEEVRERLERDPSQLERPLPGAAGPPPLHLAISFGAHRALDVLLSKGANPDIRTGDVSALHLAVSSANSHAVAKLLRSGADPSPRFGPHRYGTGLKTPLHLAVEKAGAVDRDTAALEIATQLIVAGADIHAPSEMGDTPYSLAKDSGDPAWVSLLTDASTDDDPVAFYARGSFEVSDDEPLLISAFLAGRLALLGPRALPNYAADPKPGDVVADIGCGTGARLDGLLARVWPTGRLVARDESPEAIDATRARGIEFVDAQLCAADDVMIAEQTVDVALIADSWIEISRQPTREDLVRSLYRAMKPGGVVVITICDLEAVPPGEDWRASVVEALRLFRAMGFEPGRRQNVRDRLPSAKLQKSLVLEFRRPL